MKCVNLALGIHMEISNLIDIRYNLVSSSLASFYLGRQITLRLDPLTLTLWRVLK